MESPYLSYTANFKVAEIIKDVGTGYAMLWLLHAIPCHCLHAALYFLCQHRCFCLHILLLLPVLFGIVHFNQMFLLLYGSTLVQGLIMDPERTSEDMFILRASAQRICMLTIWGLYPLQRKHVIQTETHVCYTESCRIFIAWNLQQMIRFGGELV